MLRPPSPILVGLGTSLYNMVAAEARTDDKRVVRILLDCFFFHFAAKFCVI